jgi:hypothetical protein
MSALPTKADINWCTLDVRFVPKADLRGAAAEGCLLCPYRVYFDDCRPLLGL